MNHTTLIFAVFSVLVGILLFGIWSNTHVFAQQLPSSSPRPAAGSSSSLSTTTTISPVYMTLVSSPAINLLSNNYLLYHYQAFADKGRADVTKKDNSNKDDDDDNKGNKDDTTTNGDSSIHADKKTDLGFPFSSPLDNPNLITTNGNHKKDNN